MVRFEDKIRNAEVRHAILEAVTKLHDFLRTSVGFDMDDFQAKVHREIPEFNRNSFLATLFGSAVVWGVFFLTLHFLVVTPLMSLLRSQKWTKPFHEMNFKQKLYYTSYIHAIVHALVSSAGSIYGFLYADGVRDTTWFHCNLYKLTMFDVQKYFNTISMGYLLQDLVFCLYAAEKFDGLMV